MGPPAAARSRRAATAAVTRGPVRSGPLTTISAGAGACGNARWTASIVGRRRDVLRRVDGGLAEPQAERGRGEREHRDRRDAAPDQRPCDHPPGEPAPEPGRPGGGPPAAEERNPAGVRLRAEPGEQRGQHGERAGHRDADHGDRAERHAAERPAAHQEQAGHGGHHGQPGHHDGAARGARRDAQRLGERPAECPFLPLAAQVEQRVVDADRHADDHHDLEGAAVDRQQVADGRQHADRGGQRGQREQHGDACRDERAEHDEQQDQRDRAPRSPRPC